MPQCLAEMLTYALLQPVADIFAMSPLSTHGKSLNELINNPLTNDLSHVNGWCQLESHMSIKSAESKVIFISWRYNNHQKV